MSGGIIDLGESVHVAVYTGSRRLPGAAGALAALVADSADVPVRDVELGEECHECGRRHGRPTVEYPTSASGRRWNADVAVGPGAAVAAISLWHPLGVGLGSVVRGASAMVEEAAFHPEERRVLETLDRGERERVRAVLWARKSALLRAVGHGEVIEPARIAVTIPTFDGTDGRVARSVPEYERLTEGVRFRDLALSDIDIAAIAVVFES